MKKLLTILIVLLSTTVIAQTNIGRNVFEIYANNFYSDTSVRNSHTILPSGIKHIDTTYNLLAFKDNGKIITTGYNDNLLLTNTKYQNSTYPKYNGTWKPFIIKSFPNANLNGVYVGIGTKKSNVINTPSLHSQNLPLNQYVSDTTLYPMDMGSGIYNMPNGEIVKYSITNINKEHINDDMSDILLTQIGEINVNANDELYFTDTLGNKIGNSVFVNMALTDPVGAVSMNFFNAGDRLYNANISSNNNRFIRMRTFKLSDFGLDMSNYLNAQLFNHKFSGTTDQCFILYNAETFTSSISLPINVSYFNGYHSNNTNVIRWEISNIKNGKSIELQKSTNSTTWETIETYDVELNTDLSTKYEYTDNNITSNLTMYRLKLNDVDKHSYSKVISIFSKLDKAVNIYPNPTKNMLYFNGIYSYIITDIQGREIEKGKSDNVDVSMYKNTMYFIYINNQAYKFIKE